MDVDGGGGRVVGALEQQAAQVRRRGAALGARAADHVDRLLEALGGEAVEAPLGQRRHVVQGGERGAERAQRRRQLGPAEAVQPAPGERLEHERPRAGRRGEHARDPQARVLGADRGGGRLGQRHSRSAASQCSLT